MSTATAPEPHVLIVEDNAAIAWLLRQGLLAEGYQVEVAEDGRQALDAVSRRPPDLILLDLGLPYVPGDEVCRRLKGDPATRIIPIIMVTAQGDVQSKLEAWENGADDFLTKPFHLVEVTIRCRSLLRIKRLLEERDSAEAVVYALARAVEAKSPYTHGHSERVTQYALSLAAAVGVSEREREVLRKGALLHDIGKISVPDDILNKPGKLTVAEFEVVKTHAAQGAHIVEPLLSVREAVPLIRSHHERLDGKGYPDGLKDEQIPQLVRMLSVADIYDSLSSDRPYRGAMPHQRCLQILREEALGGGLDLDLVLLFSEIVTPLSGGANGAAPPRAPFRTPPTGSEPPGEASRAIILEPQASVNGGAPTR
jgi:putative two-component system response regulator